MKNKIINFINEKDYIKFILVGGTSTLIDFVLYMILSIFLNISVSKTLSMTASCTFSYFLNKKWTFNSKNSANFKQVIKFVISQIINISINVSFNQLIYNLTHVKIISYICATILSMMVNYLLQKKIVFKEK